MWPPLPWPGPPLPWPLRPKTLLFAEPLLPGLALPKPYGGGPKIEDLWFESPTKEKAIGLLKKAPVKPLELPVKATFAIRLELLC